MSDEPRLSGLRFEDGAAVLDITGARHVVAVMAESLSKCFEADGGTNYVQYEVQSSEGEAFVLVLQKAGAPTPHQLRTAAEAERDEYRAALLAATERICEIANYIGPFEPRHRVAFEGLSKAITEAKAVLDRKKPGRRLPAKGKR